MYRSTNSLYRPQPFILARQIGRSYDRSLCLGTFGDYEPFKRFLKKADAYLSKTSNWNTVCYGGVVATTLALAEDPIDRAFFIGFSREGYCNEAIDYRNHGFDCVIKLSETTFRAATSELGWLLLQALLIHPKHL